MRPWCGVWRHPGALRWWVVGGVVRHKGGRPGATALLSDLLILVAGGSDRQTNFHSVIPRFCLRVLISRSAFPIAANALARSPLHLLAPSRSASVGTSFANSI